MSDYAALAQRVAAAVSGIRGCLLLSRDGMVLGAYPEGPAEVNLKAAWLRVAAVGEPDRCSLEFPDQTWAFVRRGSYAAFVAADVGVRPGVLLDLLEQVLIAGEAERAQDRGTMRVPEAPIAPSGKPRTSLHKPDRAPSPQPIGAEQLWLPDAAAAGAATQEEAPDLPQQPDPESEPESVPDPEWAPAEGSMSDDGEPSTEADEETEVDRILLAKEFAGLLQVPKDDDEATR